jgi:hypothetical protein
VAHVPSVNYVAQGNGRCGLILLEASDTLGGSSDDYAEASSVLFFVSDNWQA